MKGSGTDNTATRTPSSLFNCMSGKRAENTSVASPNVSPSQAMKLYLCKIFFFWGGEDRGGGGNNYVFIVYGYVLAYVK